jgi:hypothetical protein
LKETRSSTGEFEDKLTTAVYWSGKANEILEANEDFDGHASSESHRALMPSRPCVLKALSEENLRLTLLVEQLENEATRTRDSQTETENRIHELP